MDNVNQMGIGTTDIATVLLIVFWLVDYGHSYGPLDSVLARFHFLPSSQARYPDLSYPRLWRGVSTPGNHYHSTTGGGRQQLPPTDRVICVSVTGVTQFEIERCPALTNGCISARTDIGNTDLGFSRHSLFKRRFEVPGTSTI